MGQDYWEPKIPQGFFMEQFWFHWRWQGSSRAMVARPGLLGTLGCKQVGCCSCGFTGGSKVVAGPGLLGTLGCQKGAVVAVLVLLRVARS